MLKIEIILVKTSKYNYIPIIISIKLAIKKI